MIKEESGDGSDYDDADAESRRATWRRLESRLEVWYKLVVHEEP